MNLHEQYQKIRQAATLLGMGVVSIRPHQGVTKLVLALELQLEEEVPQDVPKLSRLLASILSRRVNAMGQPRSEPPLTSTPPPETIPSPSTSEVNDPPKHGKKRVKDPIPECVE